ncbi:MAG: SpoIIE family protein phosphatase [Planctomycetota bacterium]|jgi:sigma-B regulation protein RsbU (phosphoserine phosphatase)|nr:SpoIIE family protein phosphatase [Planctomycetota bacterium]
MPTHTQPNEPEKPRQKELELLANVTEHLTAGRDSDTFLDSILEGATEVLDAQRGSILVVDAPHDYLSMRAARGIPEDIQSRVRVHPGKGLAGKVALTGEPIFIQDIQTQDNRENGEDRSGYKDRSAILLPLKISGRVLGVINFNNKRTESFNEEDFRIAQVIANQVALALHQDELLRERLEKERAQKDLSTLTEDYAKLSGRLSALQLVTYVTDHLVSDPDLQNVLEMIVEQSTRLLDAQRASIMLFEENSQVMKIRAAKGVPEEIMEKARVQPGQGIAGQVVETGEALLIRDIDEFLSGKTDTDANNSSYQTKSALCIPLGVRRSIFGALNLNDKKGNQSFTEEDLLLGQLIANQASIAVHNAKLTGSFLENQKIRQALDIAKTIQQQFLPNQAPQMKNIDLAGRSIACDAIGGDYFDYFPTNDSQVGIVIGDVSGHGIGAALVMATARAFLRALSGLSTNIGKIFFRVNNLLSEDTRDDSFMTLFLGTLDTDSGCLQYASAGHDAPLLFRKSAGTVEELMSTGLPMGMVEDIDYPTAEVSGLAPGDTLLFSTDGVWEARNKEKEAFGRPRLKQLLIDLSDHSSEDIVNRVHEHILEFCDGIPINDDFSLVVAKIQDNQA